MSDVKEHFRSFVDEWLKVPANCDIIHGLNGKTICASELVEAADRIEALEAENARLRAAISWIEHPFIDEQTPEKEIRSRIKFCIQDAQLARQALAGDDTCK